MILVKKIENFVFCFVGQNRSIYNVWLYFKVFKNSKFTWPNRKKAKSSRF